MRLVVRFSSIRLMLAIVVHIYLVLKRMKDNILNGESDEETNMEQPTELWVKENQHKVCHLRSIYVLKELLGNEAATKQLFMLTWNNGRWPPRLCQKK